MGVLIPCNTLRFGQTRIVGITRFFFPFFLYVGLAIRCVRDVYMYLVT